MDYWTDNYKRKAFITFQMLYCSNDFKLNKFTLRTEAFSHPHNKRRIMDRITKTMTDFELSNKKIVAVSDNGSNIVAACNSSELISKRFSCAGHNLHLFITKDILGSEDFEVVNECITKLKRIYRKLMYKNEELQELVKSQNLIMSSELYFNKF